MNLLGARSSPRLSSAQDFELAPENRAESEVEVEGDVENEDDESEGDQLGKFTGCL
jgi:hypothetical protein